MCNDARFPLSEHIFRPHSQNSGFNGGGAEGYFPESLRHAYSYNPLFTGDGINIAVIAAFDNRAVESNMEYFCSAFSLPVPQMSVHYPIGTPGSTSDKWIVESSLDTQWIHVFAPSAKINIVFSPDDRVDNLLAAAEYASEELGADIVSMSFGTEESAKDMSLADFMRNSGSIFLASSGDTGGSVSFPSSSPHCISVGGTDLSLGAPAMKRISETAWVGGGGGASDIFGIPMWQGRFYNIYGMSDGRRATPDVAMMADFVPGAPVYALQLGGWTTVGGTSFACACFAGICACIKEKYPNIKTSTDMLSYLYGKAGGNGYTLPQYNFHDIVFGKSGGYYAGVGWDFTTGLGSPVIKQLLL